MITLTEIKTLARKLYKANTAAYTSAKFGTPWGLRGAIIDACLKLGAL
jgi:hypothetical protein